MTDDRFGRATWFDLPASNLLDAMSFYEALLGWTFVRREDSAESYVMIRANGALIGGLRHAPPKTSRGEPGQAPVLYFTVEELEPKVNRAKELGATLVGEKVLLGETRGRYQWLKDREHNLIALWAPR